MSFHTFMCGVIVNCGQGIAIIMVILCSLNNAGLFQPIFRSNTDNPKCWVKNVLKKCTVEVGLKF